MTVPRSVKDIRDHSEALAKRYEDYQPAQGDERDPATFVELRDAVFARSQAEREVQAAVEHARQNWYSWAYIGSLLGTSGEAARQRYGQPQGG